MREVDPASTKRALAFELWMGAPQPMVTLTKTFDVAALLRASRRRKLKFNMLMCWCIGKAASEMEDFLLLPVDGRLMRFDTLAVDTVVQTRSGGISTCDVPFSADLERFNADYLRLTRLVAESGEPHDLSGESMVIGTSALASCEIDSAVNIYAGVCNPFLIWGKVRKRLFRAELPVSFQFHHTQLDGGEAARFLERLQAAMRSLRL